LHKFVKHLAAGLVFTVIFTPVLSNPVFAAPSQNQAGQNQNIEMSIEEMDVKIEDTLSKIDNNKSEIVKTGKMITISEEDIKSAEVDIFKEQSLFNNRMRALYINGTDTYLQVLFSSKGISDFVSKVDAVNKVIDYDNKLIARFETKKTNINNKKEELVKKRNEVIAIEKDNEQILAKLNADKEKQNKLIVQARAAERLYAAQDSAQTSEAIKNVNSIRQATPKISLSRGSAPISDNAIIAYASNYLGTPYVWGGTSPNPGFDCSGFTQYVYRHFGISVGRTTFDQIKNGVSVSRDNLQPGDLVFFGTNSNPHHMGIYVGNGSFIHAPHTGDVIKISSLSRMDYLTARRVK